MDMFGDPGLFRCQCCLGLKDDPGQPPICNAHSFCSVGGSVLLAGLVRQQDGLFGKPLSNWRFEPAQTCTVVEDDLRRLLNLWTWSGVPIGPRCCSTSRAPPCPEDAELPEA